MVRSIRVRLHWIPLPTILPGRGQSEPDPMDLFQRARATVQLAKQQIPRHTCLESIDREVRLCIRPEHVIRADGTRLPISLWPMSRPKDTFISIPEEPARKGAAIFEFMKSDGSILKKGWRTEWRVVNE